LSDRLHLHATCHMTENPLKIFAHITYRQWPKYQVLQKYWWSKNKNNLMIVLEIWHREKLFTYVIINT
jgi:hypothetical protein